MRGGVRPQESCQFADLAAAAPGLTSLDLGGNLLARVVDADYGDEEDDDFNPSAPAEMKYLAVMLRAMPKLRCIRLGIYMYDEETGRAWGGKAWSAEQVATVRAALPQGCTLDEPEAVSTAQYMTSAK